MYFLVFNYRINCLLAQKDKNNILNTIYINFRIGSQRSVIIRLSGPIKTHWAKSLNLDINQLLGHGEYKEKYRLDMVKWGEDMRKKDYGYFCRAAIDMYNGTANFILKS